MKAENQSMLIEEAQGQQTVQAIFMQTGKDKKSVILNCQFESDPIDGELYYVFSGTQEHYLQFRTLMEDYAVKPVHEIEGHRLNPKTAEAALQDGEAAPVVDTAPASSKAADTPADSPELSATEGEIVQPEGAADVASVHSPGQPADSGQPSPAQGGEARGSGTGDRHVHGEGHDGQPGASDRGSGGEAASPDGAGPVSGEVKQAASADPFADL